MALARSLATRKGRTRSSRRTDSSNGVRPSCPQTKLHDARGAWLQCRARVTDRYRIRDYSSALQQRLNHASRPPLTAALVQVFGRRHDEPFNALWRAASKKRQGTKSREVWHWRCFGRYGDLIAAPGWRVDVTPTGCGRRINPLPRLDAYDRPLSKRLKRIKSTRHVDRVDRVERDRCRRGASASERGNGDAQGRSGS